MLRQYFKYARDFFKSYNNTPKHLAMDSTCDKHLLKHKQLSTNKIDVAQVKFICIVTQDLDMINKMNKEYNDGRKI